MNLLNKDVSNIIWKYVHKDTTCEMHKQLVKCTDDIFNHLDKSTPTTFDYQYYKMQNCEICEKIFIHLYDEYDEKKTCMQCFIDQLNTFDTFQTFLEK